jgi:hypothetical protein
MISSMIASCNSQTDLETLKYNESIIEIIKDTKETEKNQDAIYGLKSYTTEELQNFKFGDVSLSKYSVPDGYAYGTSNLYIHIDNYESSKYLGFSLCLTKEEEEKRLLMYLKKKYGNPEKRDTGGNGISLFWNVKQSNQWIFLSQNKENTRKNNEYLSTTITIVKQGTRVENSNDSKVFTILESFNMAYPSIK